MDFNKGYEKWEKLGLDDKIEALDNCVKFYDAKAVEYVTAGLTKAKKANFKKEPVSLVVDGIKRDNKDISFGDNVVYVTNETLVNFNKKDLFFVVGRNTICAAFVNLFINTASDPNRKTRFGALANGYFASITNEFCGANFEQDMMQAYEQSIAPAQEGAVTLSE